MAELVAIAEGLARVRSTPREQEIRVYTRNRAAAQVVSQPKAQLGQEIVYQIYTEAHRLEDRNNCIVLVKLPVGTESTIAKRAKTAARASTEPDWGAARHLRTAKSTITSLRNAGKETTSHFRSHVGRFTRRIDVTLPGPRLRMLYDTLARKQASTLAQWRTGMARLNSYLYSIGAAERRSVHLQTQQGDGRAFPLLLQRMGYAAT